MNKFTVLLKAAIKKIFQEGEIQLKKYKVQDGSIFEIETLDIGSPVMIDVEGEMKIVPDGSYTIVEVEGEEGPVEIVITITEGVISQIDETVENTKDPETPETPEDETTLSLHEENDLRFKALENKQENLATQIVELTDNLLELVSVFQKLSKTIVTKEEILVDVKKVLDEFNMSIVVPPIDVPSVEKNKSEVLSLSQRLERLNRIKK